MPVSVAFFISHIPFPHRATSYTVPSDYLAFGRNACGTRLKNPKIHDHVTRPAR